MAYGFDRLRDDMHLPSTNTIGQEFELNYLTDKMRLLLSQNNYIEVATFSLCSKVIFSLMVATLNELCEMSLLQLKYLFLSSASNHTFLFMYFQSDMGEKMKISLDKEPVVRIGNPKTMECEALRISLLPGILKTLAANKHVSLPLRMFEVILEVLHHCHCYISSVPFLLVCRAEQPVKQVPQMPWIYVYNFLTHLQVADVVVKDSCPIATRGTGARNRRHLCAINYNVRAGMEVVQGLLDNIMIALKVPFTEEGSLNGYYLEGKNCKYT